MSDEFKSLRAPWLVAVWPGMGHVALVAGYFLLARGAGVERVFTFAAMATQMHPMHESRVYELKNEMDRLGVFKDYEDRFLDLFRK